MPKQRSPIERFRGEYEFLSNFSPAEVKYGPYTFPTTENAFQFAKVPKEKITDEVAAKFQQATPAKAKAFGRALREKDMVRPDWDEIRERVMRYLLDQKFAIPELAEQLLRTGNAEIIEGNLHHDNDWGDCRCTTVRKEDRQYGKHERCHMRGKNKLGVMLMAVRTTLFARNPWRCPTCGSPEHLARRDKVSLLTLGHFAGHIFVNDLSPEIDWDSVRPESNPAEYVCRECDEQFTVPVQVAEELSS